MTDALRERRHGLRTPVNHILSYTRLVLEEVRELGQDDLVTALEAIEADGQQALTLIEAMLAPASGGESSGSDGARTTLCGLADRIAESARRMREQAATAERTEIADDLGRIETVARRLLALATEDDENGPLPLPPIHPTMGPLDPHGPAERERGNESLPSVPVALSDEIGRQSQAGGEGNNLAQGTLLVVDDDEANRDALARSLLRLGYAVLRAETGRAALDVLEQHDVDLVLLDIMMPELDGYAVLERRRADLRLRNVPFIVISASGEDASVIRCIEMGAEDYLPKPFDPVLLRARIGACLEKKRLHDQEARHLETIEAQAAELAEWNRTLERRVAEQVARLERVDRLKRFLPPQLAETVVATGDESLLERHRRQISVVFCDLRGFTPFSATAEPEDVMDVLSEYHAAIGELIVEYEGTLEHFAGDGLLVLFNDPLPCPDPEARAVRMAIAMRDQMARLGRVWRRRGHVLGFGIGIAVGYATLGQIGFAGRVHYAAIGSVVNLASRLCDVAHDGQILVSQRIATALEEMAEFQATGELELKGFADPVPTFEVVGWRAPE